MTSRMSYQITLRSLSSPAELVAAQAWPVFQVAEKTNFSLSYSRLHLLPYLPKSPGFLRSHLPVSAAQSLQEEGPQIKGLCSTNICLPTAVGVKV